MWIRTQKALKQNWIWIKQFSYVNWKIKWNVDVHSAWLMSCTFIELFKVLNWVQKSSSYSTVWWILVHLLYLKIRTKNSGIRGDFSIQALTLNSPMSMRQQLSSVNRTTSPDKWFNNLRVNLFALKQYQIHSNIAIISSSYSIVFWWSLYKSSQLWLVKNNHKQTMNPPPPTHSLLN